jgi:tetratricopeptide (TPR) repeat protein
VAKYYDLYRDPEADQLLNVYMGFMEYAQRDDGLFHNLMSYERTFLDEVGSDDCYGRSLWGLGYVMYRGPGAYFELAKELFEKALTHLYSLNLRGRAYSLLGLYYYLQRYPEAEDVVEKADALARAIVQQYHASATDEWPWFEERVTYDNAVIPQALFLAYELTGTEEYREIATTSFDFLLDMCMREDHISLVGNDGWHGRDEEEGAEFDQQPIDACGLVEACKVAFRLTGKREYLQHMRMAFDWFLGVNDCSAQLYSFKTGGCADGLARTGANMNQGAESTLCCLLALLTLTEVFSEQDRAATGTAARRGLAGKL